MLEGGGGGLDGQQVNINISINSMVEVGAERACLDSCWVLLVNG